MGNKYSFGNDLRDAISIGKSNLTPFRKHFERIFLKKTGINTLFSDLDFNLHATTKTPILFLYTSLQSNRQKLIDIGCHEHCNVFYPNEPFHQIICDCLNEAGEEFGLAPIHLPPPPQTSVHISDYHSDAQSIYFDVHMLEIDKTAHEAFRDFQFILRFRMDNIKHYYLIFETEEELLRAQRENAVKNIIQFVDAYCKEHDPLHIFDGFEIHPEVTTKPTLHAEGHTMGIMRNNTQFNNF